MNSFFEKITPPIAKFLNLKAITAIKNGMMFPIPFIIVGSIFLILGNIPIPAVATYLSNIGLSPILMQAYSASFGIMAVFAVFGIAYSWVKDSGYEGASAGLLAIIVDILLQPLNVVNPASTAFTGASGKAYTAAQVTSYLDKLPKDFQTLIGSPVTGVINTTWLGGQGMILAMIVGLLVGFVYTGFLRRNITIKMPEQVPENVAAAFTALIPAAVIITGATIVYGLFQLGHTTFVQWVYTVIQTPLQHATDGPLGVFICAFLPVFIWFFGIHGAAIIGGIMGPLLQANAADNAYVFHYDQAHSLGFKIGQTVDGHTVHVVTQAFMDQFITVTGSGLTVGLLIFVLVGAKSVQMKSLGNLEVGPAIFNINEPFLFGLPIVLNPILGVPFVLAPLISGYLTYAVISFGIIPPFNGVIVPWTTPAIVSGFLVGGWETAIWQIIILALTVVIYWPFARQYDRILLKQEQENEEAEKGDEAVTA